MENYQEQYKQELHQQEIRSNLQTLKGFFLDICDHFDDLGTDTATDFYRGCRDFYNGSGNVCGHRNPNSLYL